jgi:hypothetical protein
VNYCRPRRRILPSTCLLLAAASPSFSQASKLINTKTLPVSFEVNRGQTLPHIDFVGRAEGYTVYLRAGQATFQLNRSDRSNVVEKDPRENLETGINLVGAKEQSEALPEDKLPGYSNFLFGPDPHKWITDVTHYAKIRYANVYPGIDVTITEIKTASKMTSSFYPVLTPAKSLSASPTRASPASTNRVTSCCAWAMGSLSCRSLAPTS